MTAQPDHALAGKTAIVTGAAQGLGFAIAKAYVQHGMRTVLIDVNAEALAAATAALQGFSGDCLAIRADLSDIADTEAAIAHALDQFGTPRVLVHNAAILKLAPFAETSLDLWQRTLNVGVQAAFLLTKAVWTRMADLGAGSIVYVSSRSGIEGFADESPYCTAKHGLEGLMKSLALEGKPRNIAVNTITPGMFMRTPMSEQNYDDAAKAKWVDPYLLTPAFLTLAQQDANGITGQRLSAWELSQQ